MENKLSLQSLTAKDSIKAGDKLIVLLQGSNGTPTQKGQEVISVCSHKSVPSNIPIEIPGTLGSWGISRTAVAKAPCTIEDFKTQIASLEEERSEIEANIKNINDKISFMKAEKISIFDADTFRAYQILKRLKLGSLKEARDIANILRG